MFRDKRTRFEVQIDGRFQGSVREDRGWWLAFGSGGHMLGQYRTPSEARAVVVERGRRKALGA